MFIPYHCMPWCDTKPVVKVPSRYNITVLPHQQNPKTMKHHGIMYSRLHAYSYFWEEKRDQSMPATPTASYNAYPAANRGHLLMKIHSIASA